MGVFSRPDSKYWWLWLEKAPKGEQRVRTDLLIGTTQTERKASRNAAETLYHTRMLGHGCTRHGLPAVAPGRVPTFSAFLPWYREHVLPLHKGREREEDILPRLERVFGTMTLDAVVPPAVIAWRTQRLTTPTVIKHFGGPKGPKKTLPPPSPRTVNREVDVLQMVLQAAVTAGHLASSPLYGLADLPVRDPIRRTTSEAEERALEQHLSPGDWAIWLVGMDALARLGDVLDLRRSDDHGHALDIRDPKNGQALTVPISTRLRAALDRVPIDPTHPEYYFPHRRGGKTERDRRCGYAKALARACRAAGLVYGRTRGGITYHWGTRRTGATRMIRRGGEKAIGVVQQIGGWKDPTVLIGIYQETITDDMRAAVESVGAVASRPEPATKTKRVLRFKKV
jgi:integrase